MTGARSDMASGAAARPAGKDATVGGIPVRASCDAAQGRIDASVGISASPERVFRALTSDEICTWGVRPGVFDTRQWSGDLRVGGRWQASGIGRIP
jgi:hypothetical protein